MSTVRYTLGYRRVDAATTLTPVTQVSVVVPLLTEGSTFEAAADKAATLLPQGPTWKAPFLIEAYEEDED